jgi:hypothetical protein
VAEGKGRCGGVRGGMDWCGGRRQRSMRSRVRVAAEGKRVESESANGGEDQEKGADHDANGHAAGVIS